MRTTRTPIIAMSTETASGKSYHLIEALHERADGLPKGLGKAEATHRNV